ncbi:uncharacterized protein EV420DRAFT_1650378 [Desarmillaria tabescens]|uniref:Uncharacterized protein n=1 Tax=Armillaria tabescens TaxID=1929756 RepID=A0AA39MP48_ARMTA|nr:uncharacterized protein EV420DRAFT_1650378 [Desarmillaria tabescens]KAK0440884.1 hypothetical protein EV420DRAFT_1650378 [Desarmillaria tabescens]
MTEYDYSPEAAERYQATMRRISRWVDDAQAHASEYRSPFGPRSDVGDDDAPGPHQAVLTRGISQRVPPPPPPPMNLYAPVPGPMPPHNHGPAPPPSASRHHQPAIPLHGPAPPPTTTRHSSSTRRSQSKHRPSQTYYVSPTPTPPPPPPPPYYPGYTNHNPYYPTPYPNPPAPPPQYYRGAYAPPPGGYVIVPPQQKGGRSSSRVVPVVFSTSSSTDSDTPPLPPHRHPSFLQRVFQGGHRTPTPVTVAPGFFYLLITRQYYIHSNIFV